ncbi:bifunctional TolB-family protein/amidohydrolase [Alishewanella longhuensis]
MRLLKPSLLTLALSSLSLLASEPVSTWQVNAPLGEFSSVDIQVQQGSWMNVSVSPDGKTIVFDLLGDIYTMPITGGTATALTADIAWNMQPVFSPDGKYIAFTSDRDGGDNIWIMDADGQNSRSVTKETFRLLNSPAGAQTGNLLSTSILPRVALWAPVKYGSII